MSGRSVSRHEIEQLLERLSNIENECGTLKDKQSQFAQNLDDTNADLISLRNDVRQLQKFAKSQTSHVTVSTPQASQSRTGPSGSSKPSSKTFVQPKPFQVDIDHNDYFSNEPPPVNPKAATRRDDFQDGPPPRPKQTMDAYHENYRKSSSNSYNEPPPAQRAPSYSQQQYQQPSAYPQHNQSASYQPGYTQSSYNQYSNPPPTKPFRAGFDEGAGIRNNEAYMSRQPSQQQQQRW